MSLPELVLPAHKIALDSLSDFLEEWDDAPDYADVYLTEAGTLHIAWDGVWQCENRAKT